MKQNVIVVNQVLTEFINVSRRLLKISKTELLQQVNLLFANCAIIPTTHKILKEAQALITEYDFQIFDAIIVASALEANCTILFSEDMQHDLVVRNKLTIKNPFR
jgi:predicted nucleic acid-binding protein